MNRKGATLGDLYPAVLTIVLVVLVLGIGLFILSEMQTSISNDLTSVTNETITPTTAGVSVAEVSECGASNFAVVIIQNATNGPVIDSGNYTFSSAGLLANTSAEFKDAWNITYNYRGSGDATYCTAINTSVAGIAGLATWIAIIVVVLAAAIIIGLVIRSFARGRGV